MPGIDVRMMSYGERVPAQVMMMRMMMRMMSYGERVPAQVKTIKNGKENGGTLEINDDYES